MKKLIFLMTGLLVLTACGQKSEQTTETSTSTSQSLPNATIHDTLTGNEAESDRTQTFRIEKDNEVQTHIITHQGDKIKFLSIETLIPVSDETKETIATFGLEETQKAMNETIEKDESFKALKAIKGLTAEMSLTADQKIKRTFAFDVFNLDTKALAESSVFEGSGLERLKETSASQYINNITENGAKEVTN